MATHVAEGAGAEIETFAPVAGMIIAFDERTILRHTQPEIPIQPGRDWIFLIWFRFGVTPHFAAPGVHLFHFADCTILDEEGREPILDAGMHLDSHLRYDLGFARLQSDLATFKNILGER